MRQKGASSHTICSYRDSFRLLFEFANTRLHKSPSRLTIEDLNAPFIGEFLDHLENNRNNSSRSRNHRLSVIRSFFKYVAIQKPDKLAHIERILSISSKRTDRTPVDFLTRPEINALLAAQNEKTWAGRRDHALLLLGIQTGLRVSELTNLRCEDIVLDTGAHVRCRGKGRKDRCTPLTKQTVRVIKPWLREQCKALSDIVFPNARGNQLTSDGVQYILSKYTKIAQQTCPSLKSKRVSPHILRHTAAMELLQAGVDTSVIALWLGHESSETTQIYLKSNMALKEKALEKVNPLNGKIRRYRPDDQLLSFLNNL
jgi:site-specific recombinase XerD